MHKLKTLFLKHKSQKGFTLVETLVVMGLGTVLLGVYLSQLTMSAKNVISAKVTMAEQDLKASMDSVIGTENYCKGSLLPKNDTNDKRLIADSTTNYKGEVKKLSTYSGTPSALTEGLRLLEYGDYKGQIDIIKMELLGIKQKNSSGTLVEKDLGVNPHGATKVHRRFAVFYKKKGLGKLDTIAGKTCTTANTQGCYYQYCDLEYRLDPGSTPPTEVAECTKLNCAGVLVASGGGTGGSVACYTERQSGTDKAIYVGCGTTKGNTEVTTTAYGFNAGKAGTGQYNTLIGWKAGSKTTGYSNTFIGYQAGENNTSGLNNTFIGLNTGRANTTNHDNVFIGSSVGGRSTGWANVFIGAYAGSENTTSSQNTFIGFDSGLKNTAQENTFVGFESGEGNTTGASNTFIGHQAGKGAWANDATSKPVIGNDNVAIGNKSGYKLNTGYNNTFVGLKSGESNTVGANNTFIGRDAGRENIGEKNAGGGLTKGYDNTYIGSMAGMCFVKGVGNVFIGRQAGVGRVNSSWQCTTDKANNTGYRNIVIGQDAGYGLKTGYDNVLIGFQAGFKDAHTNANEITGHSNILIGTKAGKETTSASNNIFIGESAGSNNKKSGKNIVIGNNAGKVLSYGASASETDTDTKGVGNILIGDNVSPVPTSSDKKGGIAKDKSYQLNIGNLLFGRMPSKTDSSGKLINDPPSIDFFDTSGKYLKDSSKNGLIVNGNLYVRGEAFVNCKNTSCSDPLLEDASNSIFNKNIMLASSRMFKNNITLFKNYQYSLSVINNTPLFNYYYNKDHPKHKRMGIISEDLPKHLQIQDKGKPIQPDWVSIYGTLWAGIKALYNRFMDFKKEVLDKINNVLKRLDTQANEIKELKKQIQALRKEKEVK